MHYETPEMEVMEMSSMQVIITSPGLDVNDGGDDGGDFGELF